MHPEVANNGMQASDVRSSSNSLSHNIYEQQDCYITGNIGRLHSDYGEDDDEGEEDEQDEQRIQQSVRKYLGRAANGRNNYQRENHEMEDDDDDEEMERDGDEDQDDYQYDEDQEQNDGEHQ